MIEISVPCEFDLTAFDAFADCGLTVSFFGAPPYFKLDGGRIIRGCKDEFGQVIGLLKRRSLPFNLSCNTVLDPTELEIDDQTWQTIEQAYSPDNGVIVARHWLAQKIRDRYPHFRFIFSSIGALAEEWDEDVLFSNYDVVVCPIDRTNDFSFLTKANHWSQLEIFLNAACIASTSSCLDHYRHHSEVNNAMIADSEYECPLEGSARAAWPKFRPTFTDVASYLQLGVKKFKCIDRLRRGQDFREYFDLVRHASFRNRALAMLEESYRETTDPLLRIKIMLRQSNLGITNILEPLKGELSKVSGKLDDQQRDLAISPALDMLRAADPAWVSGWAAERIANGFLDQEYGARWVQPPGTTPSARTTGG